MPEKKKMPIPGAQTPEDFANVHVEKPKTVAGGLPAMLNAAKIAFHESGALRGFKTWRAINQRRGFDCPGCAWPDPDENRSAFEFCENGAKAIAEESTTRRVTPEFFAEHLLEELAQQSDHWLGKQGRLTYPMRKGRGDTHYEAISWEAAFALIAKELNALNSPDEAVFYTSGRTSNEAAFLYQLFVRQYGTNNLPDCSNMCHESSGWGLSRTIGVGKGTVTLHDIEDEADAIFILGQNPGTNHPRMLTSLQKAARRGGRIVTINPLSETGTNRFIHPQEPLSLLGEGTPLTHLFLQVRINGDVALLKGIMKAMAEAEDAAPGTVFDHTFIQEYTHGIEPFLADLRAESWDVLCEESGIDREAIQQAATIAMQSEKTVCCWAMGLTQHKNGVANVEEIVNFLLLRGHIGRPGAGVCPVRGHSNVQGDRTMGIWEQMPDSFLDRLGAEFAFAPPRSHGYDTVDAIKAMSAGKAKVFFGLGGNFLSATPDTEYTAQALRNCRLTVHVSTKLNRAHLVTGEQALILPCLGRTEQDVQASGEQFVSVEDSMGVVHPSRGTLAPASPDLLSEPAIVCRLAKATLGAKYGTDWSEMEADYDAIRERIANVVTGFDDYNTKVRAPGGFYLPNAAREREFRTDTGKANFTVHPVPRHALGPNEFLLMTIRSHDQFNTTIYDLDDRYRGVYGGRRVVFLNADDIARHGFADGQLVDLIGTEDDGERIAPHFRIVAFSIPPHCAAAYYPETNVLVPIHSVADVSNTPVSKSVRITLRASES